MECFGLLLRLRRKQAGYTPAQLAIKIGIKLETLAAIEFGFAPPKLVKMHLPSIANGLGISPQALGKLMDHLIREKCET